VVLRSLLAMPNNISASQAKPITFDRRDATPGERELYVAKIKRWWGTRKTRENSPNKKQYNFVLANDVNTALDKLAQGHKLSRTKILDRLIINEAETGLHPGQVLRKL
jgi:hypothetical protein